MWQNVAVCENGELQSKWVWNLKWPRKKIEVMVNMGEKQKVVVKLGVKWQNVSGCENGKLQPKQVWNLKWPCKKMEVMVNMGEKQKVVVKLGVESEGPCTKMQSGSVRQWDQLHALPLQIPYPLKPPFPIFMHGHFRFCLSWNWSLPRVMWSQHELRKAWPFRWSPSKVIQSCWFQPCREPHWIIINIPFGDGHHVQYV
jgi:hypothetical protein